MGTQKTSKSEDYLLIHKDGRFRVGRMSLAGDEWQLAIYTDHRAARWPLNDVVATSPLSPSQGASTESLNQEGARQLFEDFAKKERGLDTTRLPHGDYRSFATGEAWAAWVASMTKSGGGALWAQ